MNTLQCPAANIDYLPTFTKVSDVAFCRVLVVYQPQTSGKPYSAAACGR